MKIYTKVRKNRRNNFNKGARRNYLFGELIKDVDVQERGYQITMQDVDKKDEAFVFLDSPYEGKGDELYNCEFEDKDFQEYARFCGTIQSKIMITLNDSKSVRDLFSSFNIYQHTLFYGSTHKHKKELVITNYTPNNEAMYCELGGFTKIQSMEGT